MRILLVALAVLALAGCSSHHQSADSAATTTQSGEAGSMPPESSAPGATGADAALAASPRLIEELTDQKLVHECPKCGMDFDAAGTCTMDGAELVATRVDYTCPKDGQAVAQAGKCPRCPMSARVEKTAMATAPAPSGN